MDRKDYLETLYGYGELLVQIANAKSSDEAGSMYVPLLKATFGFPARVLTSDGKPVSVKNNRFITLKEFESQVNEEELHYFDFLERQEYVSGQLNSHLIHPTRSLKSYDAENGKFTFEEHEMIYAADDTVEDYDDLYPNPIDSKVTGTLIVSVDEIIKNWDEYCYRKKTDGNVELVKNLLCEWAEVIHKIEEFRKKTSEDRLLHLAQLRFNRQLLLEEHSYLNKVVSKLQQCLDYVAERNPLNAKDLLENPLKELIDIYNNIDRPSTHISDNGLIYTDPLFPPAFFIDRTSNKALKYRKQYYAEPVCYCLVEVLKDTKMRKRIKKCKSCGDYFVEKKLGKKIYCSDKCRLHVSNKKRIESGEHAQYKRKKRQEGAKESYYG